MTPEEREKMVDHLLDQALASYSQAEPRPGLEERVLAGLRSQPARRPWWTWVLVPVAAAVLVSVGLYVARRPQPTNNVAQVQQPGPSVQPSTPSATVPAPAPAVAMAQPKPQPRKRVVAQARPQEEAGPHLAVFPTPTPLSSEEELLLGLVRRQPQEARVVAEAQAAQAERIRNFLETGVLPPPEDSLTSWH